MPVSSCCVPALSTPAPSASCVAPAAVRAMPESSCCCRRRSARGRPTRRSIPRGSPSRRPRWRRARSRSRRGSTASGPSCESARLDVLPRALPRPGRPPPPGPTLPRLRSADWTADCALSSGSSASSSELRFCSTRTSRELRDRVLQPRALRGLRGCDAFESGSRPRRSALTPSASCWVWGTAALVPPAIWPEPAAACPRPAVSVVARPARPPRGRGRARRRRGAAGARPRSSCGELPPARWRSGG